MALSDREAIGIAWCELLYAVGESVVDRCDVGVIAGVVRPDLPGHCCNHDDHWHVLFTDGRAMARGVGPRCVVGRVWVDKRTGHCNVWINEDYDPGSA